MRSFTMAAFCLIGRAFSRSSNQALHCLQMCDFPQNGPETQDVAASEILLILGKERFTSRPNKSKWVSVAAEQQDAAIRQHLEEVCSWHL